jgi:uncharacterized protein (DUF433 family)
MRLQLERLPYFKRQTASYVREPARRGICAVPASGPEILGGDPVFRGTRVLVHTIAELIAQGSTAAELIEGYPLLTTEMIRLAPVYAAAYPLRGRPRKQPWSDQQPVHRGRRKLDARVVS